MSIFRYPGGKTKLMPQIAPHLDPFLKEARLYGEPFAGGGNPALYVARHYPNLQIALSDLDPKIAAFWSVVACGSDDDFGRLMELLRQRPTVELFLRLRNTVAADKVERAYRGIFFNRTTFGGIATSGPLGGYGQRGDGKIASRYNAQRLIRECTNVRSLLKGRTIVHNLHAVEFVSRYIGAGSAVYLDPPYFEKGPKLYRCSMSPEEHRALAALLKTRLSWVLSYDDHPFIRSLYHWAKIDTIHAQYSSTDRRRSNKRTQELLIAPMPTRAGDGQSGAVVASRTGRAV